jgi:hypothetical protein
MLFWLFGDLSAARDPGPVWLVLAVVSVLAQTQAKALDVLALADGIESTSGMLRYVRESSANEFIICTERGLLHRLKLDNPDNRNYHVSIARMKEEGIQPRVSVTAGAEEIVEAIVTGRMYGFAQPVIGLLPCPVTAIVSNGAVVKSPDGASAPADGPQPAATAP